MIRAIVALLFVALALLSGCRNDTTEVRVDLTRLPRLVRALRALSKPPMPPPPEVTQLTPERLNDLGVMVERRGMLAQAEQYYRTAVERKPDFARAWVNLGNVLRQRGRDQEAGNCYRRAMNEDPSLFEAVNNFADLCADTGEDVDEAIGLLQPALAAHPPEEAIGRDTLGKLWLRAGRPHEAATELRAAFMLSDPRDTDLGRTIQQHLAQAYRALGQLDAAQRAELRAAAFK